GPTAPGPADLPAPDRRRLDRHPADAVRAPRPAVRRGRARAARVRDLHLRHQQRAGERPTEPVEHGRVRVRVRDRDARRDDGRELDRVRHDHRPDHQQEAVRRDPRGAVGRRVRADGRRGARQVAAGVPAVRRRPPPAGQGAAPGGGRHRPRGVRHRRDGEHRPRRVRPARGGAAVGAEV
ncbi:MAG: hypothetical protein AVDCRST_MAG64-722, partial [uncultured Phycisphaerae bacterium]